MVLELKAAFLLADSAEADDALASAAKKKVFSQKMHLKIPLLSRDLKVSNSEPGCRVSALRFFVK
jgi:hypothetical protein